MPANETLESIVLIEEIRTCKCGQSWHAPATVRLLVSSGRKSWTEPLPDPSALPSLPRTIKQIRTQIPACPSCFMVRPPGQLDLFTREEARPYIPGPSLEDLGL